MPTDLSSMSRIMQNLSSAFGISQEAIEAAVRAVSDFVYESIVEAFPEGFDDQTPVSAGYGEFAEVWRCYDAAPEWKIHQQAERQLLYLYAMYVKKKYGRFPDVLRFMMFRKNTAIDIPFKEEDFNEALKWAKDTVQEIRDCWDYAPTCDEFFSEHLCNHREYCDNKI